MDERSKAADQAHFAELLKRLEDLGSLYEAANEGDKEKVADRIQTTLDEILAMFD